jgi:hypothetical protein
MYRREQACFLLGTPSDAEHVKGEYILQAVPYRLIKLQVPSYQYRQMDKHKVPLFPEEAINDSRPFQTFRVILSVKRSSFLL